MSFSSVQLFIWNGFASNMKISEYKTRFSQLLKENDISHVWEFGSFLGNSTISIAEMLPDDGKIYAIDPWENVDSTCVKKYEEKSLKENRPKLHDQFLINISQSKYYEKIKPIKMTSTEACLHLVPQNNSLGFYIDALHTYDAVLNDLNSAYTVIKNNNIKKFLISGDDWGHIRHKERKEGIDYSIDHAKIKNDSIIDNVNRNNHESQLNKAVIDFANINNFYIKTFGKLWWLEKREIEHKKAS